MSLIFERTFYRNYLDYIYLDYLDYIYERVYFINRVALKKDFCIWRAVIYTTT